MVALYTPSGMSIEDAEKLSQQQQTAVQSNLPKEGEVFLRNIGEGANQLSVLKGGQYYGLGFQYPTDWQGKTIGQWQNQYNSQYASQLGLDLNSLKTVNSADFNQYYKDGQTIYDTNQFKTLYSGTYGGATTPVPSSGGTVQTAAGAQQPTSGAYNPNTNPYFGVPTSITNTWTDPATGQSSPTGVGMPAQSASTPPPGATYISSPDQLKGLTESQIWRERDASGNVVPGGKIYQLQQATLTSPTGQKKVVGVGSPEASQLLSSGWTLGDKVGGGTVVNTPLLTPEDNINLAKTTDSNTYAADTVIGGAKTTSTSVDEEIKKILEQMTPKETDESRQLDSLLADIGLGVTGKGAMQATEEEKRQLETKRASLASVNTRLKTKLAEVDALTASYQLANQQEEGRPQTLSRLQGAQAQNYKMYIAQHNLLASQAGIIQAEALGLTGEIEAAQNAANRAVDLAFADKESVYNAKVAQANILQNQVSGDEARYTSAVLEYYKRELAATTEAKQNAKDIQSIKLQAITSGITDPNILSQIGNAKSVDEAIQILGTNIPKITTAGKFTQIGSTTDIFGNTTPNYGFVNEDTGSVSPFNAGDMVTGNKAGYVSTSTGETLDMGSYAKDTSYVTSLQSILDGIGQFKTPQDITNYIKSVSPSSPITAEMIQNASQQFGVSWEGIAAVLQKESTFGTSNVAQKNNNPGGFSNVGIVGTARPAAEGGYYTKFATMQDGINAVARNLARRQKQPADTQVNQPTISIPPEVASNPTFQAWAKEYASTGQMPSGVKPQSVGFVAQLAALLPKGEGTLVDVNTLVTPSSSSISQSNKEGLLALYDLQQKSEELKTLWDSIAWTGLVAGTFSKVFPTQDQQKYNALRTQITDLLTRARTGAALTEQEAKFYGDLLPTTFNKAIGFGRSGDTMINSFIDTIGGTLETKLEGYGSDIIGRQIIIDGKTYIRAFQDGQLGWISNE